MPSSARFRFLYRVDLGIDPYAAGGFGLSSRCTSDEIPQSHFAPHVCQQAWNVARFPRVAMPPLGKGAIKSALRGESKEGPKPLFVSF